ncbi:hypothetical protein EVG20_g2781 [Dentipellis fragilis]|uniref:beta-glucosidase n=1 Tax=Dentipellis fragilis TaxID=205917 RepID=A0A4Y9Z5U3_9AGAM|nr:hypothetical protein EVG20_g2781 [Dentipellis fragilis]
MIGKLSLTWPKRLEDNPSYGDLRRLPQLRQEAHRASLPIRLRPVLHHILVLFPRRNFVLPNWQLRGFLHRHKHRNADGRETAQVYVADPSSALPRPVRELKGFAKVALKAGESKTVEVELDRDALAYYDEKKGAFVVSVGPSSRELPLVKEVELAETFSWTGLCIAAPLGFFFVNEWALRWISTAFRTDPIQECIKISSTNMLFQFDVEETLKKLSMPQKVQLLAGLGFWHTQAIVSAGIKSMRMSDVFNGVPSSCFPSATGIGSSFDIELAREIGDALADECRAKSVHILLGPTVNTQRSPLGGRGFESFSEDPHLNGTIAAAYIQGVQAKGVATTLKHFVANEQEYQRFSSSSEVNERALREIYLKPFQIVVKKANPWVMMAALNRVNGIHASENKYLIEDILRKEWGWKGMIMSDWTGLYSTSESIKAGLDLEMPGPTVVRGGAAERAIQGGKIFPEDIDARVRKILELYKHALASGIPFNGPEKGVPDTPRLRNLLRRAASAAVVLLKNDKKLLPLNTKVKSVAVIGPNAKRAFTSGGGSAELLASYTVSPLQGIDAVAKDAGFAVEYATGATTFRYLPVLDGAIQFKHGDTKGDGALLEFWNHEPVENWLTSLVNGGTPVWSMTTRFSFCPLIDGVDNTKVNFTCWYRYSAAFTPDRTGNYKFELIVGGRGTLFINGKLVIDLTGDVPDGSPMFGAGTVSAQGIVEGLKGGEPVTLEARLSNQTFIESGTAYETRGGVRLGATPVISDEDALEEAIALAKKSDVAVVVVGLNNEWEGEGFDRPNMKLPGRTDQLVSEILKANSKTAIVNQSGTQVEMPWVDQAHTLLQAFYGGNELGNGLADILFGKTNPSGKLALTFPKRLEDNPSYLSFGDRSEVDNKVYYTEGIYAGYRYYDAKHVEPLFPFGYGLSYTHFSFSNLSLTKISADGHFVVRLMVTNSGPLDGSEIVQVYIVDPVSTLPRPQKELKGYLKVTVKAGENMQVGIDLDRDALGYYDERRRAWIAEKGTFEVWVGSSSRQIFLKGSVELKDTITWDGL